MAEKMKCLKCGYVTVRCGMTNHLKTHPEYGTMYSFKEITQSLGFETKEERLARKARKHG